MTSDTVDILDRLTAVLQERQDNPSQKSYTAGLFAGGEKRICGKISEEAAELIEAAITEDVTNPDHLIHESADLIFHVMVLLVHRGLTLDDVRKELARRFGMSGLEEKANRQ